MGDNLFTARNAFFIGNFQLAISEASTITPTSESNKHERDCLLYRSYIALGKFSSVLDAVKDDPSVPVKFQAIKLLARYLSRPDDKEIVLFTLKEWLEDDSSANDTILQLIGSVIYLHEGNKNEALKSIRNGVTLEQLGVMVHTYIQMNRVDLAEKQLKTMQSIEDESTLTQLAVAWVYLAKGGASIQEAAYIFQELSDKYGATPLLLNGLAVSEMHMNNFPGAERILMDALAKDGSNADTLINLLVCSQHLRKSEEVIDRYMSDLKRVAPHHRFIAEFDAAFAQFDALVPKFALH